MHRLFWIDKEDLDKAWIFVRLLFMSIVWSRDGVPIDIGRKLAGSL